MYKIATLNNISPKGLICFNDRFHISDEISEADGILVRSFNMHEMDFSPNLKAIARAGAGVNNIPIDKCSEKGIVVFNTPGANANAVKELVLTGLLISSRQIVKSINWTTGLKGKGSEIEKLVEKGKKQFSGNEIKGKTLAVIGLGAIGVMVANSASALGMKVFGYDPFISVKSALELSRKIRLSNNLEDVLSEADYITLHIPMIEDTKHMINKTSFSKMKEGVKLLNFSRGEIVDDDALMEAIHLGIIHRYVTDFPNDKLLGIENVLCVPHLGASTPESEQNCAIMAVDEISDYLENGNITNSVNFPDCSLGICVTAGRIGVLNKNIPNMVGKITNALGELDINISEMNNRSKGPYAYTLVDTDTQVDNRQLDMLRDINGIIAVRVIK